jgi:hypothetical protein
MRYDGSKVATSRYTANYKPFGWISAYAIEVGGDLQSPLYKRLSRHKEETALRTHFKAS